jgi:mono/diheme cytochrome c family protein
LRRSIRANRPRRPLLPAALVAAAALLTAGCGATTEDRSAADPVAGKELFVQKCGGCHALADAGTLGQTGPNLDDGFGFAREQGFEESTFFEVTLEKMRIPGYGSVMPDFDESDDPDNFLEEHDLVSIADYVASVAGTGAEPAPPASDDPQELFATTCGSCHVFSDAGTTGTTGPNLDESNVTFAAAVEQITQGGGGMPPFEGQLTEAQIEALAEYITARR